MTENIDELAALKKIKEAKELLDIDAITQEEFDQLKAKYLKQLNNANGEVEVPKVEEQTNNVEVPKIEEQNESQYQGSVDILGTVIDSQRKSTKRERTKKSDAHKMLIKATEGPRKQLKKDLMHQIVVGIITNELSEQELQELFDKYKELDALDDEIEVIENNKQLNKAEIDKEKQKYIKNKSQIDQKKHDELMVDKQGLKTCPICHNLILKNAIRCKYCKTTLKKY